MIINPFVLVELGSSQKSPARSPTRTYIPLQVAELPVAGPSSPVQPSNSTPTKANDGIEQVLADGLNTSFSPGQLVIHDPEKSDRAENEEAEPSVIEISPALPDLSLMSVSDPKIMGNPENTVTPPVSQSNSPRFTAFLTRSETAPDPTGPPEVVSGENPPEHSGEPEQNEAPNPKVETSGPSTSAPQELVITRQEAFTLSSVLGRIPRELISQTEVNESDNITLNVIEDPPQSPDKGVVQNIEPMDTGPSQENVNTLSSCDEAFTVRTKRQRPKYSLRVHMLRKHPVLKFSATGPIDRNKTPYKWWCRVCRVELSLMSRGVLELLSHFKTDSHLIKEHRISLEIPGMSLYDKFEKELTGNALLAARRTAKET